MNITAAIHQHALAQPHSPAYVGERTVTYGELRRGIHQLAGALLQAGVARGDVVAIVMPAPFFHIVLTLAVAHLGGTSVPLTAGGAAADYEKIAKRCGISCVVSEDPAFLRDAPSVHLHLDFATLISSHLDEAPPPMARSDSRDVWRIGFSSGTTGRPKAIRFDHRGAILRGQLMRDVNPIAPGERVAVWMPPGLPFATSRWLHTLMFGGTVVGLGWGKAALEAIHRLGVNSVVTSTGNASMLAQVAASADGPLSRPAETMKSLSIGGAGASPALRALLRRHICANLNVNYGATEVGVIALSDAALQETDPTCAGRVVPWVEVQAVDEKGNPLVPGSPGQLRMRSPIMAVGYVPGSEHPAAAPAFRDGWFYSSDVGTVSQDGLVHLLGRKDDVINLGGTKFDPSRIENVICEDPAVIECAVLVLEDRLGSPILAAAVIASPDMDVDGARARCRAGLGERLTPTAIVRMDSFPRNAAGKVQRDELTAQLLQKFHLQHPAPSQIQ